VGIVILVAVILVSLVFLVLLVRFILQALAARRHRREEEEARNASQSYSGPSRGRLIVREGPAANLTFHLVEDVTYVGRSPDNHVSLPDSSVGKRHCSISIRDRSFQVEDLQSVNGVFVNGQKVLKAFLKDGDSIRLGSSEMQFRL
jgi:pSer/pThr/pTyr-binding forkhead associated (FHA) protein